jgi:hypothetical protein
MVSDCTDCNKRLARVNYVRALRPGEVDRDIPRDPLCYPCWVQDYGKVRAEFAKSQLPEEESVE